MRTKTVRKLPPCPAWHDKEATPNRFKQLKRRLSFTWFFASLFFLVAFFSSSSINAQYNCTSNDVRIVNAFLSTTVGGEISCVADDPVSAALHLIVSTKTPRQGVYISADLYINGLKHSDLDNCFFNSLTGANNDLVYNVNIPCPVGKSIELRNVFVAWGTGSDQFCPSSTPATPSKCRFKEGEVIVVELLGSGFTFLQGDCTGTNRTVNFTGNASGGIQPYTYEWFIDYGLSTEVKFASTSGSTSTTNSASYSFASGQDYSVTLKVTDDEGSVKLTTHTVPVIACCIPPSFTDQTAMTTVTKTYGDVTTTTYSITAAGDGLLYRWEQSSNGVNGWSQISGASNSSYTVPETTAGTYYFRCIVTGDCGELTSNVGTLTINKALLTITANDVHKNYGSALSTPVTGSTAFTSSGLQNGETIGSVTIAYGNGRLAGDAVTTYADQVTPSAATGGTFNSANYTITYAKGDIIVDPVALTITAEDKSKTYDGLTFTGSGGVFSVTYSGFVNGETSSVLGGLLSFSGDATTATAAGTYTDKIVPGGLTSSNYTITFEEGTLTISPATLCLTYDGLTYGVTNTSGCYVDNNGKIRLILTVLGSPAGNLSTAVVKVSISGSVSNQTATYVPAANGNPAYFYYDWTVPCLGTNVNSIIYEVEWTITGNYDNSNCSETEGLITISRPTTDFTTGGGYIMNNKSKGTIGIATNETPSKNNYGFNLKWGNNQKVLQGNFNTIIRQGGKQYQVKSNKPTYLLTKALPSYTMNNKTYYPYEAIMVYENAVIKDLTSAAQGNCGTSVVKDQYGNSVCSMGGGVVYLRVVDNGEPNTAGTQRIDQISMLVKPGWNINSVFYSSEAYTITNNPAVINLMDIVKGNIQVHTAGKKTAGTTTREMQEPTALSQRFEFTATPNPTRSYFTVQLSNESAAAINLRVTDVLGRTVESKTNLAPGSYLQIGNRYKPGVYIVEMIQGNTVKQLKLVKQ